MVVRGTVDTLYRKAYFLLLITDQHIWSTCLINGKSALAVSWYGHNRDRSDIGSNVGKNNYSLSRKKGLDQYWYRQILNVEVLVLDVKQLYRGIRRLNKRKLSKWQFSYQVRMSLYQHPMHPHFQKLELFLKLSAKFSYI